MAKKINLNQFKLYLKDTEISLEEVIRLVNDIYDIFGKLHDMADFSVVFYINDNTWNRLFERVTGMVQSAWNPFEITDLGRYYTITLSPETLLECYLVMKIRGANNPSKEYVYKGIRDWFEDQLVFTFGLLKLIYDEEKATGKLAQNTDAFQDIKTFYKRVLDVVFMNVRYLAHTDYHVFDEVADTSVCLVEDNSPMLINQVLKEYKVFINSTKLIESTNESFRDIFERPRSFTLNDINADIRFINSLMVFTEFYMYNEDYIVEPYKDEADEYPFIFAYYPLYKWSHRVRLYEEPLHEYKYEYDKETLHIMDDALQIFPFLKNMPPDIFAAFAYVWKYNTEEAHHKQWVIDQMLKSLLTEDEYDQYINAYIKWYNNDHEEKATEEDLSEEIHGIAP